MVSELKFEIKESLTRGKFITATVDILPGSEIYRENPLMILHVQDKIYDNAMEENLNCLLAALNVFRDLDSEKQKKYLDLYGPLDGQRGKRLISFITASKSCTDESWLKDIEKHAKIASIYAFNAFVVSNTEQAIYETSTRFSHSCQPNCYITSEYRKGSNEQVWRTILPIKAGEELTIAYTEDHSSKPTHFRRWKYLTTKDFTCHCPRCDALGDDTRQFNCFDKSCRGYHLVHQPLNEVDLELPDIHYTGVEYEAPHLLPCTDCQRLPPLAYEVKMFDLELSLPKVTDDNAIIMVGEGDNPIHHFERMLRKLVASNYPTRHILSLPIQHKILDHTTSI